jgi:hypothetical protein
VMTVKLFDYQEKLVEEVRQGNSVLGNWARGAGKDFVLGYIVVKVRPRKMIYVERNSVDFEKLRFAVEEVIRLEDMQSHIKNFHSSYNKLRLELHNGELVEVLRYVNGVNFKNTEFVIFNNQLPTILPDFPDSLVRQETISLTTLNNHTNKIQNNYLSKVIEVDGFELLANGQLTSKNAKDMLEYGDFYNEFAIKSSSTNKDEISFLDFKHKAMQKLMNQFLKTPDSKDTVLTRKNIIEMIKDLGSIGN